MMPVYYCDLGTTRSTLCYYNTVLRTSATTPAGAASTGAGAGGAAGASGAVGAAGMSIVGGPRYSERWRCPCWLSVVMDEDRLGRAPQHHPRLAIGTLPTKTSANCCCCWCCGCYLLVVLLQLLPVGHVLPSVAGGAAPGCTVA